RSKPAASESSIWKSFQLEGESQAWEWLRQREVASPISEALNSTHRLLNPTPWSRISSTLLLFCYIPQIDYIIILMSLSRCGLAGMKNRSIKAAGCWTGWYRKALWTGRSSKSFGMLQVSAVQSRKRSSVSGLTRAWSNCFRFDLPRHRGHRTGLGKGPTTAGHAGLRTAEALRPSTLDIW
ncbi:hypothetical protein T310_6488, partial [Rasamsonia emersonii CBS 393.64]